MTTKEQAQQMVDAHESAAARAKSSLKIAQHLLAATLIRRAHNIPEPYSFGQTARNVEGDRAIQEQIHQLKTR